jgi:D-serine dehydratase
MIALADTTNSLPSVYDVGLDNRTIADGLAVARASPLVMREARALIDAAVALPEHAMLSAVRQAWHTHKLRIEPSAAAALAAMQLLHVEGHRLPFPPAAAHIAWLTGGGAMPDEDFADLLGL